MMTAIDKWFLVSIILISPCCFVVIGGFQFSVTDYGAYPNDDIDDASSIQWAVNAAINNGSNNMIVFPAGIFTISATVKLDQAVNLTVTGQGADQTLILGCAEISIFTARLSQGLTITSLAIDYSPLPFTAGYVVNVNPQYIDIRVQAPHQADVDRQIAAILRYDPIQMRPAFGPNSFEIYQTPSMNMNTTLVSPGILRLPLVNPAKFAINDAIVARYAFRFHSIDVQDLVDFTVRSVRIYTSWAMGLVALRVRRLTVIDYHVHPADGRWMSTTVDCMHFIDSREYVHLFDSKCQGQGDDGLNVHAAYFAVSQIINATALILKTYNWLDLLNLEDGTRLEFSPSEQQFSPYFAATIASSADDSPDSRVFTFTEPINVHVDDWVCVADTPALLVVNFTVTNNRARGALLETRNVNVTRSVFNQTSGPAIFIQPSLYWHEGPAAHNVTLSENLYINCNEGIAQERGVITILPDPVQLVSVISDVRIESSTFLTGPYSLFLLQSSNGDSISIRNNYVATNASMPLVSLCNSRNITANNNTVFNHQTVIDQYYVYDETQPCQMNLTSLIDLPPSAFNSSFPPPVALKNRVKKTVRFFKIFRWIEE